VREFAKWLGKDRIRVYAGDAKGDIKNFGLSVGNQFVNLIRQLQQSLKADTIKSTASLLLATRG
jgi:hypothetical protein